MFSNTDTDKSVPIRLQRGGFFVGIEVQDEPRRSVIRYVDIAPVKQHGMSRVNGEVHEKILHRFGSVLSMISAGACTRSFTAITIARSCMSSSISGGLIVFSFISFNFEVKAAVPLCLHLIGKTLPQPAVFLARRLFGVEYFCNLLRTACFEEVFNR